MSGPPAGNGPRGARRNASHPDPPQPLLAILGPTGSGKSDLAFATAQRLRGEIIGCDALQVYRGLNAATAKPPPEQRRRVPHHLVDCVDPSRDFSLAEFVGQAEQLVQAIRERGNLPIVVGGTGLYLRGLLRGIVSSPPRDEGLRRRIHRIWDRRGGVALHRWLRRLDPATAERLAAADRQRVARAIEFALISGEPLSERLRTQGTWESGHERFAAIKIGLRMNRATLFERLDRRVDRFFDGGLVEEVRGLLSRGLASDANALRAIGYREVVAALREGRDPNGARDEVKRSTRRYAKRQETWIRGERDVHWLDAETSAGQLCDRVVQLWRSSRTG